MNSHNSPSRDYPEHSEYAHHVDPQASQCPACQVWDPAGYGPAPAEPTWPLCVHGAYADLCLTCVPGPTAADRVAAIRSNLEDPSLSPAVVVDRVRRLLSDEPNITLPLTRADEARARVRAEPNTGDHTDYECVRCGPSFQAWHRRQVEYLERTYGPRAGASFERLHAQADL